MVRAAARDGTGEPTSSSVAGVGCRRLQAAQVPLQARFVMAELVVDDDHLHELGAQALTVRSRVVAKRVAITAVRSGLPR